LSELGQHKLGLRLTLPVDAQAAAVAMPPQLKARLHGYLGKYFRANGAGQLFVYPIAE